MSGQIKVARINLAELIEISNAVNEQACRPIAEQIADEARALAESFSVSHDYQNSIHVEVDPRTGEDDWARSRVVATAPYSMQVESRHGVLARAMGAA